MADRRRGRPLDRPGGRRPRLRGLRHGRHRRRRRRRLRPHGRAPGHRGGPPARTGVAGRRCDRNRRRLGPARRHPPLGRGRGGGAARPRAGLPGHGRSRHLPGSHLVAPGAATRARARGSPRRPPHRSPRAHLAPPAGWCVRGRRRDVDGAARRPARPDDARPGRRDPRAPAGRPGDGRRRRRRVGRPRGRCRPAAEGASLLRRRLRRQRGRHALGRLPGLHQAARGLPRQRLRPPAAAGVRGTRGAAAALRGPRPVRRHLVARQRPCTPDRRELRGSIPARLGGHHVHGRRRAAGHRGSGPGRVGPALGPDGRQPDVLRVLVRRRRSGSSSCATTPPSTLP